MIDVRALANIILDQADSRGIEITNMALNKITYFVHCDYLIENNHPLVKAKIEAWQHGPVFREVYHEFKRWEDSPIRSRATKVDPFSGEVVIAKVQFGEAEGKYIANLIDRYIEFSAAYLRAVSHKEGGPWHVVWGHDGRANPGMKISDDLILQHYSAGARQ
ncbi:Panacea domain-containing protein [Sphingobium sp. DC-2]|uniref:Panacea domain-containing protein n=1 Tax=Sphingobium sp. DC-2 TaxID=1303256 RepID=UPI0009DEF1E5|nr:type II toxin-antitoxin system antitoxin SocA domain-containing protein [Sphingobium sp. DC-2]